MPSLDRLKTRLMHLCIAVTLFTSGLFINLAQCLCVLIIKPINKSLSQRIMSYLCFSIYSQLVFLFDWHSKSSLNVYMDEEDEKKYAGKENVFLIMNHTYEIDWLTGWTLTEKLRVLGNTKAFAKKIISYMPVIGWAWKFGGFVFLERSFEKDKEIIANQIKEAFSSPDPAWLLLNAEGTRFTRKKHEASVKFAQERGIPPLKHHLIPRTKGFTASLPTLRGRCPVIYDISLAFKRDAVNAPTLVNIMSGKPVEGYMFVRRIPLETVPEDEKEAAEWLQNLYREKDRIIDSFHTTGSFFKTSGFKETAKKNYPLRLCTLINFSVWGLISLSLVLYYLIWSLLTQNWIGLSIVLSILLIFYILMEKTMGMSEISKSSTYGSDIKKIQ